MDDKCLRTGQRIVKIAVACVATVPRTTLCLFPHPQGGRIVDTDNFVSVVQDARIGPLDSLHERNALRPL